jgi:hypothetical protein
MSAAFYSPFGGFSPGPRYLIVALPFLALGLAPALRAAPLATGALATASIAAMALLTATHPQAGYDGAWAARLADRDVPLTAASLLGITGWYAILPLFAACALAGWLGLRSAPWPAIGPQAPLLAGLAVAAWALLAATADDGGAGSSLPYAAAAALVAAGVLVPLALDRRRAGRSRPVAEL